MNKTITTMAKKKKFTVRVAYKVYDYYDVEATSEERAIEKALEQSSEDSLNDFIQEGKGEGLVTIIDGKPVEPKKREREWQFDEQKFIEEYCPMAGGNDYLGWIDDICKLLDGETEEGDAASTGEYANMSEDELRKELKRLTCIVLKQAVDEYVEHFY